MSMTLPMKLLLARAAWPLAAVFAADGRLLRWWRFACLRTRLPQLDASTVVLGMPELRGEMNITSGRHLLLYRDVYLETQGDGAIGIGDGVVLSRGVHIVAHAGVDIGAGSMIGEYASVRDANHRFGAGQSLRSSGHAAAPVSIGRNVWIGRGAAVLAGVSIGDGAVIGANAVVTRDVPAGGVAVGAPARPLRRDGGAGARS